MSIEETEQSLADLILDACGVAEFYWDKALSVTGDNRLGELIELVYTLKHAYQLALVIDAPSSAEVAR